MVDLTFRDIIDLWPSLPEFAADIGVPVPRAKGWKDRSSIPAEYFRALLDAAIRRDLTAKVTEQSLIDAAARHSRVNGGHHRLQFVA